MKLLAIGRHRRAGGTHHIIGRIPELNEDAIRCREKTDTAIECDEHTHCAILSCSHILQDVISDDRACARVSLADRNAQGHRNAQGQGS